MSKIDPVSIKDPLASEVFKFSYEVGDLLKIRSKGEVGIVKNAIAEPGAARHFKVYLRSSNA